MLKTAGLCGFVETESPIFVIEVERIFKVFLCGPEKMVNYVSEYLINAGLPKELVHFELFVTGLSEEDIKRTERLAQQNVEGFVVLSFDITETGATDNVKVVKSVPAGVFDKSAKVALKQWEYKPRIQGGKGVRQTGLLVQLDYQLGASLDTASVEKNASPDVERIIVPPKQSK